MIETSLIILIILAIINIAIGILKKTKIDLKSLTNKIVPEIQKFDETLERTERSIKDEFQRNRAETNEISKTNREELSNTLKSFEIKFSENTKELNELLRQKFEDFSKQQSEINNQTTNNVKEVKDSVEKQLKVNREEQANSLNTFTKQFSKNIKELNELLKEKFTTMNNQQSEFNKQITVGNKANREELGNTLKSFEIKFSENTKELNELLRQKFADFSKQQMEINKQTTNNVKEVKDSVENQLKGIREDNIKQLGEMRRTVDEKLQKTLNERLSQSFETVSKQLQAVQEGLGEMKTLATDVGGLKKVLSNVKMRGVLGEIQLAMLLEQILAPDQYAENVQTKFGSSESVEFAIKLPGRDDLDSVVWLPIDAKFPKDIYEQLVDAYEEGEQKKITVAQKNMESVIKKMAKDIRDKYLNPPQTTDFGIMFLPFEGIYAEVVRNTALLETLQRDYKIIVTGPTTLAAILNSLQMGFKTLVIQKRSSEVWQVLGAVKKEFENFGGMMNKAQKNIQTGLNQLDDVMGKRTRAIQRKLKSVETLNEIEARKILPEISDGALINEEEDMSK